MTPLDVERMMLAYLKAKQAGTFQLEPFLTRWPDVGPELRELLVSQNSILTEAEAAGDDMDAVYRNAIGEFTGRMMFAILDALAEIPELPDDVDDDLRLVWQLVHQ